jgi:hypothetical protein
MARQPPRRQSQAQRFAFAGSHIAAATARKQTQQRVPRRECRSASLGIARVVGLAGLRRDGRASVAGRARPQCSDLCRGKECRGPARPLPAPEPSAPAPSSRRAGRRAARPWSTRAGPTDKAGSRPGSRRDALQHAVKAQVGEMISGEAIDENAQQEQDDRAAHRVPRQLSA